MIKNKLKNSFTDKDGKTYPNVLEYRFEKGETLSLGKLFASSHNLDTDEYGEGIGFYVYEDLDNPSIGYRIYREFNNPYDCDEQYNGAFIQKLQSLQDKIQLTEFPYGVITLDNRVVGQIIPIYHDAISLRKYVKDNGMQEDLFLECLLILKELCANGIYYLDMNADNFLITEKGIKLIDFEKHEVDFDKPFSDKCNNVINNFKVMLRIITNNQICEKYSSFINVNTFEELEEMFKGSKEKK